MSIRNLDVLFKPRSIALIGASKEASSLGAILAHNLFNAGFAGPVMPVNAEHQAIEGVLAYPDPADLAGGGRSGGDRRAARPPCPS